MFPKAGNRSSSQKANQVIWSQQAVADGRAADAGREQKRQQSLGR